MISVASKCLRESARQPGGIVSERGLDQPSEGLKK